MKIYNLHILTIFINTRGLENQQFVYRLHIRHLPISYLQFCSFRHGDAKRYAANVVINTKS